MSIEIATSPKALRELADALEGIAAITLEALAAEKEAPIDMVLHCPACGMQHIDVPEFEEYAPGHYRYRDGWDNPSHRSHLCHGCGHIWRPADVPTNGVAAVKTQGKADSPLAAPQPAPKYAPPLVAIGRMVSELMDISAANGANSVSMTDHFVEVAAWLSNVPPQPAPRPTAAELPLPAEVLAFDQYLNEPPSDEGLRDVRSFRCDAWPKWEAACKGWRTYAQAYADAVVAGMKGNMPQELRTAVHGWHERAVRLGADGIENLVHAAEVAHKRGALRCADGFVDNWLPPTFRPANRLKDDDIFPMYSEPSSDAEMLQFAREVETAVLKANGLAP